MKHPFFTSDTHFHHTNVIRHSNRPFQNSEEMNETLIERINSVTSREDDLYHLGDVSFASKFDDIVKVLDRINAKVHLVFGNHDKKHRKQYTEYLQGRTYDYLELKHDEHSMVLCHFPFYSWNKSHYGSTNLHGHCHGALDEVNRASNIRRFDVGVDCNNFYPVGFIEIMQKLEGAGTVHHHNP